MGAGEPREEHRGEEQVGGSVRHREPHIALRQNWVGASITAEIYQIRLWEEEENC